MDTMKLILLVMSALLVFTNLWLAFTCPHLKSSVVGCRVWYKRMTECNVCNAIIWLLYGAGLCLQLFTEIDPATNMVVSGVQAVLMLTSLGIIMYGRYCCMKGKDIRLAGEEPASDSQ